MTQRPQQERSQPPKAQPWLLRRTDQSALAVAVVVCLAAMSAYWLHHGGLAGRIVDINRAAPLRADFQVDINRGYWFEFAQIPDIGETLGRRIVEERELNGPFLDHADLRRRVRGIGPKTLENMRPYLLPLPPAGTIVDGPQQATSSG